ncbi:MAG: RNA-binding transcriptional accessory protein [Saprospiraceae bacterium]|nr:RNA-binding transcriptional accessory protein [Saprospiraceae bacterium]MCB0573180.1 RNA-binding transcriptional accessory protein [Saprospiraceae bacterium]MCB9306736.1 RNA-binding transcriptional accessory protein [Lewinellaceae bacterium]
MSYAARIAPILNISAKKVEAVIHLLESGATIPFIARYRKEATGELDEVQIADIQDAWRRMQELDKRRETILQSIEEQGKLTPELRSAIESALTMTELEDLYLPYRPKRKTRASVAIERGLEPLAKRIFAQKDREVETIAGQYINDEVPTIEEALQGARDIIAEWLNEDKKARDKVRRHFEKSAVIASRLVKGKEEAGKKYLDYFEWSEPLKNCPSHRLLAMRRGEEEGFLRVSIAPEEEVAVDALDAIYVVGYGESADQVRMAVKDSYKRLLQPSIETEFRNSSKEKADMEAIRVFAENLRQLLLSAPLGEKRVLGIDPGFRTGCKVVCLDANGNLLHNTTIYPHEPQRRTFESQAEIEHLTEHYGIDAISVGNGTAGRETMDFLRAIKFARPVEVFQVNEAGASIYSASEVAREEFPDQDVTVRGAVSIGRRLMDPLAELVKIDPKSIGVGQYQHDVNQPLLKESLDRTVESCVNAVGINLNTASKHLLTYVSGLGPVLAQNIVTYRAENGPFGKRGDLKKVPRLGDKAFEQCAGFLRIREAKNPLDNTAVHPERYALVEDMASDLGCGVGDLIQDKALRSKVDLKKYVRDDVGLPTLQDILKELEKPGLDPRGAAKAFEFANVHTLEDLQPGMILPGIVTNITNFGAFVDIGVKDSGLVHVSQMADKFVRNPMEVVSLGQQVTVRVLEVDFARKRVALSMKGI